MARNQRDENIVIQNPNEGSGIFIDTAHTTSNGVANVTISNVAPAAVGTATISRWLVINLSGTSYYIPMWT